VPAVISFEDYLHDLSVLFKFTAGVWPRNHEEEMCLSARCGYSLIIRFFDISSRILKTKSKVFGILFIVGSQNQYFPI
jgi:hypothetical protein